MTAKPDTFDTVTTFLAESLDREAIEWLSKATKILEATSIGVGPLLRFALAAAKVQNPTGFDRLTATIRNLEAEEGRDNYRKRHDPIGLCMWREPGVGVAWGERAGEAIGLITDASLSIPIETWHRARAAMWAHFDAKSAKGAEPSSPAPRSVQVVIEGGDSELPPELVGLRFIRLASWPHFGAFRGAPPVAVTQHVSSPAEVAAALGMTGEAVQFGCVGIPCHFCGSREPRVKTCNTRKRIREERMKARACELAESPPVTLPVAKVRPSEERGLAVRYTFEFEGGLPWAVSVATGSQLTAFAKVYGVTERATEEETRAAILQVLSKPRPMLIFCPTCNLQHIDRDEWATKPHRTHLCERCGGTFRPCNSPTVGVEELPQAQEIDHV